MQYQAIWQDILKRCTVVLGISPMSGVAKPMYRGSRANRPKLPGHPSLFTVGWRELELCHHPPCVSYQYHLGLVSFFFSQSVGGWAFRAFCAFHILRLVIHQLDMFLHQPFSCTANASDGESEGIWHLSDFHQKALKSSDASQSSTLTRASMFLAKEEEMTGVEHKWKRSSYPKLADCLRLSTFVFSTAFHLTVHCVLLEMAAAWSAVSACILSSVQCPLPRPILPHQWRNPVKWTHFKLSFFSTNCSFPSLF